MQGLRQDREPTLCLLYLPSIKALSILTSITDMALNSESTQITTKSTPGEPAKLRYYVRGVPVQASCPGKAAARASRADAAFGRECPLVSQRQKAIWPLFQMQPWHSLAKSSPHWPGGITFQWSKSWRSRAMSIRSGVDLVGGRRCAVARPALPRSGFVPFVYVTSRQGSMPCRPCSSTPIGYWRKNY